MVYNSGDGDPTSETLDQTIAITADINKLTIHPEGLQDGTGSPSTTHNGNAIFRLMDLPGELRNLVFWHTVTIDTFTIQDANLFDLMGHTPEEADKMINDRRQCLNDYRALARVNRQIHGEIVEVFFVMNRFEFWLIDSENAARLGDWLHRVHDSFVARMRKVRIVQALRAADASVDITLPKDGCLYELAWNGESWHEELAECTKEAMAAQSPWKDMIWQRGPPEEWIGEGADLLRITYTAAKRRQGRMELPTESVKETPAGRWSIPPKNAYTAAKRGMRSHAKSYRKQLARQNLPRPYVNHAVEPERGRTRERPPMQRFSFTPEVLRRIMGDVAPTGALELPIGVQRFPCRTPRGCVSPDYCSCDECEDYKNGKKTFCTVSERSRRRGLNGSSAPFTADYDCHWAYDHEKRKWMSSWSPYFGI